MKKFRSGKPRRPESHPKSFWKSLRFGMLGCLSAFVFLQVFLVIGGPASPVHPSDRPSAVALQDTPPAELQQQKVTSQEILQAYRDGLNWLRRHQFPEGVWSPQYFHLMCRDGRCDGAGDNKYHLPLTAMSLLAFLNQDYLSISDENREAIQKGIDWLYERQGNDGSFLKSHAGKFMYGQAMAAEAMARGYLATGDDRALVSAQRAVRFLEQARNPGSVWRYGIQPGDNDTSVTAWVVSALFQMKQMGYEAPPDVLEGIAAWVEDVTDKTNFAVAYRRRGQGQAFTASNRDFVPNEAMTAAGLMMRRLLNQQGSSVVVQKGIRRMLMNLPQWDASTRSIDFYYWHMGTRAFDLYRTDESELWQRWAGRVGGLLVSHQRTWKDGCLAGSWDPVDKWGQEGGRVYATAINVMTLALLLESREPQ